MTDAKTIAQKPAGITPSATVGPFFKYGLTSDGAYPFNDAFPRSTVTPDAGGERIVITGRILDGDGAGVPDAMIEIWQADGTGRYMHPLQGNAANSKFRGFARADTDKEGGYRFQTIKPGTVAGLKGAQQAPHIMVALFARGMLRHLYTRIYFADETTANAADGVLALVPAARRNTLLATRGADGAYRFDIRIQGGDETVFFAV
jgi:protocatechuate 3,4-dioxygenase, alpha subunit